MSAKKPGLLVTFEGTEGAGKTTLIQAIKRRLARRGVRVVTTREPGGHPLSERIRDVILSQEMTPWTELFLYEAARSEHLARVIRPALTQGAIVLCDRFTDSSLAYQGHARGLPWKQVILLNTAATQGICPDLTVLLDIDPALGLKRAAVRTRFEDEGVRFQKRVRQGFLRARREDPKRWLVLKLKSPRRSPEELAEAVIQEFGRRPAFARVLA